jgi:hypothetical protein
MEMQPYSKDIVFVGGWVHALYLADAGEIGGIGTEDIDITIPHELLAGDRPTLLELAERAGFERDPISDMEGVAPWMVYTNADGDTVPIDFLTEGVPRVAVQIIGQPGLFAQAYPGQNVLLENAQVLLVGPELHDLLTPPRAIRVPTLGAYVLQKGISASTRTNAGKRAKDHAYIHEIVRHPKLGTIVFDQLPPLQNRYPKEHAAFLGEVRAILADSNAINDVAEQLSMHSRSWGSVQTIRSRVVVWLQRLAGEG